MGLVTPSSPIVFAPSETSVNSPMTVAFMPSFANAPITLSGSEEAIMSAPEDMSLKGSSPKASQIAFEQSVKGTRRRSSVTPVFEKSAISKAAPSTPPSVTSCMRFTQDLGKPLNVVELSEEARGPRMVPSLTTEMSSPYVLASSMYSEGIFPSSLSLCSLAAIKLPSIAAVLVMMSLSPGLAWPRGTGVPFSTTPNAVEITTKRLTQSDTSV